MAEAGRAADHMVRVPVGQADPGAGPQAKGMATDLPRVLGLPSAPVGQAHQGDQDLPVKEKGRWALAVPRVVPTHGSALGMVLTGSPFWPFLPGPPLKPKSPLPPCDTGHPR